MSQILVKLALGVGIIYVALCVGLFFLQRSLIYYPQPRIPGDAAPVKTLRTAIGDVLVTTRSYAGSNAVVYFGGNAENVASSLTTLSAAFPEQALYLLNYRGYGGSAGKPTEAAIFSDALSLFDEVRAVHQNITVVGRSLGSGVATMIASERVVQRVVLITPYDSIQEIAARQFPYFPVRLLLRDKFESWKYAEKITAPVLVIAAERDEVIPRASTESLFAHFRSGIATMKTIAGVGHNTISDSSDYIALLRGAW